MWVEYMTDAMGNRDVRIIVAYFAIEVLDQTHDTVSVFWMMLWERGGYFKDDKFFVESFRGSRKISSISTDIIRDGNVLP